MATAELKPIPATARFGAYEVVYAERRLYKNGVRVQLQRQPFDVLCALLEKPGQVVFRDELRQRLWADNTFVEYEDSLNTAIRKLRAALSDCATSPRYIETVARQGYRFIAPVQTLGSAVAALSERKATPLLAEVAAARSVGRRGRRLAIVAAMLTIGLLGSIAARWSHQLQQGKHSPTAEAQSRDLYQKGRLFWEKRTSAGFNEALKFFHEAIALDPRNARAYAGIADTYALMSSWGFAPADEVVPKARAAALKAIDLDAKLAEPHASLGLIAETYDFDWQTAEDQYRRAIELDSSYAIAHHWYAECLALQGRFAEAMAEIDTAQKLDSASLIIQADRAAILYFARQYAPAVEQFKAVLAIEPYMPRAFMISWAYIKLGRTAEAREEVQKWERIGNAPWPSVIEAHAAVYEGHRRKAEAAVERVAAFDKRADANPIPLLLAYTAVGDNDKAFHYLDLAIRRHAASLISLKVDPVYDPLRSDPRFNQYLKRLDLAQ